MDNRIEIAAMTVGHWPEVADIYRQGIETGLATFETEIPDWEEWDKSHLPHCRLIARDKERKILGWGALSPVSDRCVYGGVAEVSIYVSEAARGRGVGTKLLSELVKASETNGLWTLQAGIFAENKASIKLHEKCGFRIVGRREKLGQLRGEWKDVILMERRSGRVGIEN